MNSGRNRNLMRCATGARAHTHTHFLRSYYHFNWVHVTAYS